MYLDLEANWIKCLLFSA